jgi:NhaP-type Na+/H+ or K+/H+ antiporter
MYIGAILPWESFHDPTGTGITIPRLFGLGFLVLVFRRLPAILTYYKAMPGVCKNWKEALFMGYFGPIGAGAVFYVEHARKLFPQDGEGDEEQENLVRALAPTVYWLVLFSIVIHGLSIPALNIFYHFTGKQMIKEDATEVHRASMRIATPNNAIAGDSDTFIAFNRFSRQMGSQAPQLPVHKEMQYWSDDEHSIKEISLQNSKSELA